MQYTYEELEKIVDEQLEAMCANEKYQRLSLNDPTFEEWVLSAIRPGDTVMIDFQKNDFKIVEEVVI